MQCGGWDGKVCLRSVEYYDADANMWRKAPDMTVARSYGAAAQLPDTLMVLGGWDGKGMERLRSVECLHVPRTVQKVGLCVFFWMCCTCFV